MGAQRRWNEADDGSVVPLPDGKPQLGPNSPHNGISGDARRSAPKLGKKLFDMKVDYAVRQIQGFLAPKNSSS